MNESFPGGKLSRRDFLKGLGAVGVLGAGVSSASAENISTAEQVREKWQLFNQQQTQNALFESIEIGKDVIVDDRGQIEIFQLSEGTAGSADILNKNVVALLDAQTSNPDTLILTHTHLLQNKFVDGSLTQDELEQFRSAGRSVHTPPSQPDIVRGVLIADLKDAGHDIDVLNQVYDGEGVWLHRNLTPDDYDLFPEVEAFYSELKINKKKLYGNSAGEGSVGEYLALQSDEEIDFLYSLVEHKYPNKVAREETTEAIWSYLQMLDRQDFEGMNKNMVTAYQVLVSDDRFQDDEILMAQYRGMYTYDDPSIDAIQRRTVQKSIKGTLTDEDFEEISLQYAKKGVLLHFLPGDKISSQPPGTDPATWMRMER